ncbi:SUN domain-containing protein 2 [Quillaja saponaria]|uniref:SUN domain-containing protein 2 n=1 Tax=Quillaja saponaria TaxID=32244 RepID=A0AAD7LVP0_QUISA|nr:SUN domain-containing protein 2 [Quillaja saponaria]
MKLNPIVTVLLFVLVLAHGSDASLFFKSRKLVSGRGLENTSKSQQDYPSPSPTASINSSSSGNDKPSAQSHKNAQTPHISPAPNQMDGFTSERCPVLPKRCRANKNLTGCIHFDRHVGEEKYLLIQNDGKGTLQVNVTMTTSHASVISQEIQLPTDQAKKISISEIGEISEILLKAGNGECRIYTGSVVPETNFFEHFPSFATYVTPVHGAYLLFVAALIIGGTWTCCKLVKRGRHVDGVPYQELEMGQADSFSANNVETAEGWDQDWDDDWDESKALKSPNARQVGNRSVNGLASRSSDRDAWGNDWND